MDPWLSSRKINTNAAALLRTKGTVLPVQYTRHWYAASHLVKDSSAVACPVRVGRDGHHAVASESSHAQEGCRRAFVDVQRTTVCVLPFEEVEIDAFNVEW